MAWRKIREWFVSRAGGESRSFFLCPSHSSELREKRDKLNASLAAENVVLSESTTEVGPFGVRLNLPVGARCAKCFEEPPYEPMPKRGRRKAR